MKEDIDELSEEELVFLLKKDKKILNGLSESNREVRFFELYRKN